MTSANDIQDIIDSLNAVEPTLDDLDVFVSTMEQIINDANAALLNWQEGQNTDVDEKVRNLQNKLVSYGESVSEFNSNLVSILQTTNKEQTPLRLSEVQPNWYQLVAQFQMYLARKGTWKDMNVGRIGTVLSEYVGAVGMFNQQAIEVALRENYIHTARRDSSIYAATESLGVRITRKIPANTKVAFTRNDFTVVTQDNISITDPMHPMLDIDGITPINLMPEYVTVVLSSTLVAFTQVDTVPEPQEFRVVGSIIEFHTSDVGSSVNISYKNLPDQLIIEPFTVFAIGSSEYFNRDVILVDENVEMFDAYIYEGEIREQNFNANDSGFQVLSLADGDFAVSDFDVSVQSIDKTTFQRVVWTKSVDGLWLYGPNDEVFFDRTNGRGYVEVMLGDGTHGKKLDSGDPIIVTYAVTSGSIANRNDIGLTVSCKGIPTLRGTTLTRIGGGVDQKEASYYRTIGPYIRASKGRLITTQDYRGYLLNYANIADVVVQGQRSIDPTNLKWMNVLRFCILTETGNPYNDAEWDTMVQDLQLRGNAALSYVLLQPDRYEINVVISAFIHAYVDAQEARANVEQAVRDVFRKQAGILGRMVSISDLVVAARVEDMVDYVEIFVNGDTRDIHMPDIYTYPYLKNVDVSIGYSNRQAATSGYAGG